jgi:glycosyltransferase involved in cell wall biosynthesis
MKLRMPPLYGPLRDPENESPKRPPARVAIVGPVYPFRAGIAYCTTRLAEQLGAEVVSFKRQFPKMFYPGGDDVDPTLPRAEADFILDVVNPLTWFRAARRLRDYDTVIFVWWIWVWALPYRVIMALLPKRTKVVLQCHNIGDKEPAAWKRALTNIVLRRADVLVVHAESEAAEALHRLNVAPPLRRRSRAGEPAPRVVKTFLPVHELGGAIPSRDDARRALQLDGNVALFFGHVRPFKGLDIALRAWRELKTPVTLLVAGEAWWKSERDYRELAKSLGLRVILSREDGEGSVRDGARAHRSFAGAEDDKAVRFEFRFIPDAEIATYFAAADVVLAPYRIEAQSGVALTAFHFARPVIATTVGGLPEVIDGENGILVPPEDASALARAVDEFFTSRDRGAMERAAAASARRYSWEEYGALFERLALR